MKFNRRYAYTLYTHAPFLTHTPVHTALYLSLSLALSRTHTITRQTSNLCVCVRSVFMCIHILSSHRSVILTIVLMLLVLVLLVLCRVLYADVSLTSKTEPFQSDFFWSIFRFAIPISLYLSLARSNARRCIKRILEKVCDNKVRWFQNLLPLKYKIPKHFLEKVQRIMARSRRFRWTRQKLYSVFVWERARAFYVCVSTVRVCVCSHANLIKMCVIPV